MFGIGTSGVGHPTAQPNTLSARTLQTTTTSENIAVDSFDFGSRARGLYPQEHHFHRAAVRAKGTDMQSLMQLMPGAGYRKELACSNDEYGLTALHKLAESRRNRNAASQGELGETVHLLLSNGANIDAQDAYERTPLMLAAMEGDIDMLHILLDSGANLRLKDSEGCTAEALGELNFENDANRVRECFIYHKQKRSIQAIMARQVGKESHSIINFVKRKCADVLKPSKKRKQDTELGVSEG